MKDAADRRGYGLQLRRLAGAGFCKAARQRRTAWQLTVPAATAGDAAGRAASQQLKRPSRPRKAALRRRCGTTNPASSLFGAPCLRFDHIDSARPAAWLIAPSAWSLAFPASRPTPSSALPPISRAAPSRRFSSIDVFLFQGGTCSRAIGSALPDRRTSGPGKARCEKRAKRPDPSQLDRTRV